jgi:hypothetical protein
MNVDFASLAPNAETVGLVLVAFLSGGLCPVYYFQERMRGFGRAMVSQLPYKPPPGKDREEALVEATESTQDSMNDDNTTERE